MTEEEVAASLGIKQLILFSRFLPAVRYSMGISQDFQDKRSNGQKLQITANSNRQQCMQQ